MAGANSVGRQGLLREIAKVESKDQIGSALDVGSKDMAIFRVRKLQGWDEGLIAIDQCIAHMSIHQRAGALQLQPGEIRAVTQRILGQPRYPNSPGPPAVVAPLMAELIRHPQHQFWPDSLSLLALAVHHGGRLVSFDRRLSYEGVAGGREALWLIDG